MFDDDESGNMGFSWKKPVAVVVTILFLAVGMRAVLIYSQRRASVKAALAPADMRYTADAVIHPRRLHQSSLQDARALNGKRIWVFAAAQLNAYPIASAHVDYTRPGSFPQGAQPLDVVNFIEVKAPADASTQIPKGDAQVVMLYHRAYDTATLWGAPIGYRQGMVYTFYLDDCFFYDDPHTVYKQWPAATWQAISDHRVLKNMNQLQTALALTQSTAQ